MTAGEQRLVEAAADTFFPAGGPIPVSGRQAGAVAYLEGYMQRSDVGQRLLIRLLWRAIELGPLAFGPRRVRFTKLNHEERKQFLDEAFTSRLYFRRVLFISLRALHTMAYFADARVLAAMGMAFDPDPFRMSADDVPAPAKSGERLIAGAQVADAEVA